MEANAPARTPRRVSAGARGPVASRTPACKPILAQTRGESKLENITVLVGTIQTLSGGQTQDLTREVELEAEKLAEYREFGYNEHGNPIDSRGVVETLYKTADDRLVAHVKDWSHWQGEPNAFSLHEVSEADLSGKGRFAHLGREAGMGRPLTLAEALAVDETGMYGDTELSDAERLAAGQSVPCTLCQRAVEPGKGFYSTTEGAVICMDCSERDD